MIKHHTRLVSGTTLTPIVVPVYHYGMNFVMRKGDKFPVACLLACLPAFLPSSTLACMHVCMPRRLGGARMQKQLLIR